MSAPQQRDAFCFALGQQVYHSHHPPRGTVYTIIDRYVSGGFPCYQLRGEERLTWNAYECDVQPASTEKGERSLDRNILTMG